ncbi:MAG: iron uptake porin, partial [Cyanobacteriota bacterium]|nr:iron uptake porin [Cyanobacteriota bacterium]
YQALSNLIERYGCVAGYPNGTYKGGQAMTRFEAAALLNACLDRVSEVTDELKKLMKEFEKELAILKGRVDGLEARVGELEAHQFSTTTKLRGKATFVVGANSFSGRQYGNQTFFPGASVAPGVLPGVPTTNIPPGVDGTKANGFQLPGQAGNPQGLSSTLGATVFNYDVQLAFDTSFTGKDLLRTTLRAGNFGANSPYGNGLTFLETAFEENLPGGANNIVGINRLFYNFPVGQDFSVTVGGRVRIDDPGMLGLWPSAYPADTVLDFFTYAGAPGAYNLLGLGGGAGATWNNMLGAKGLSLSANYVSATADSGNPNFGVGQGGLMSEGSQSASVIQLAYAGDKTPLIGGSYGIAFAYSYSQNLSLPTGTPLAVILTGQNSSANNYGLSGYWTPSTSGIVPSISWGLGTTSFGLNSSVGNPTRNTASSWYVGLQWLDAFIKGNAAGMAVGQAPFVTNFGSAAAGSARAGLAGNGFADGALDSNYMWEWWYKFQVTDNISITPALYYIANYQGQLGRVDYVTNGQAASNNVFGGLIKTTFKF